MPHDRRVLPREFYLRDALRLARALLGKELRHEAPGGVVSARIVEVEAYRGPADRAAHSSGGRRTARNEVMYGPGGHVYVYFIYGMHFCMNVVASVAGRPEAVLLRAAEPLAGIELMRARRPGIREARLLAGPGNLCRALGVDRRLNGTDLTAGPLVLLDAPAVPARRIARGARIGVDYAGEHAALPWRLWIDGHPSVSRT
ncbi:MAG: DNA-3-methyladenine glycosylase [Acidobacteria bacterium]|nr:DNA-3-methyladenine glycosylase [Acidobacteriota bacterium]